MKNLGPPPAVPDNAALEAWCRSAYEALKRLDARYYPQEIYVTAPEGNVADAGKPIKTDATGKIITQTYIDHDQVTNTHNLTTDVDHNDISGQQGGAADDYYHLTLSQHTDLTDSGDCLLHKHDNIYFTETEHISTSAGAGDAGKPIKLNASGKVDKTMITGTGQAHIVDASTANAITDPGDSPASADALRDDLVTNTIPTIETALNNLGTVLNAVLVRLETAEINLTS